jgi:hypothetical protein
VAAGAPQRAGRLGTAGGTPFDRAYLLVPLPSWVPDLLAAERYLATGDR